VLAVFAIACTLAGCDSGDDGGSGKRAASSARHAPAERQTPSGADAAAPADANAIRAVIIRLFKSNDVRWICGRALTQRLVRAIYAGRAQCRKLAADEEDDKPPRRVEVSAITTRRGGATARARLIGGDAGGADGVVSLVKSGADWQLDGMSAAFLRSVTTAVLRNDDDVPARTGRCIDARLARVPDERFKALAYGLLGQRPRANARLLGLWYECERARGGASSLRRPLEKEIAAQLRRAAAKRAVVGCVIRRLRSTLPDKLLIRFIAAEDRRSKLRLNREVLAAAIACGFEPRSAPGGKLSPA
jgi:hypothetical protein